MEDDPGVLGVFFGLKLMLPLREDKLGESNGDCGNISRSISSGALVSMSMFVTDSGRASMSIPLMSRILATLSIAMSMASFDFSSVELVVTSSVSCFSSSAA